MPALKATLGDTQTWQEVTATSFLKGRARLYQLMTGLAFRFDSEGNCSGRLCSSNLRRRG